MTNKKGKEILNNAPKQHSMNDLILSQTKELAKALPKHLNAERMGRIVSTCLRLNPDLGKCTTLSLLGSVFTLAQVGLEPINGLAYLIPFNNNRRIGGQWKTVKEVQAVIGYKGLVKLFYQNERAVMLSWGTVKEKDHFAYQLGTEARLEHRPASGDRGATIGYWVMAQLKGGGKPFHYMSIEECLAHGKKHSKTYDAKKGCFNAKSPWHTNFDSMALKTVLIQVCKLLPLSSQLMEAVEADETNRDLKPGTEPLDVTPTQWNGDEEPEDQKAQEQEGPKTQEQEGQEGQKAKEEV